MTRYGKRTAKNGRAERAASMRMLQLMICLAIFSIVYVAKGVFPHKIQRLGEQITTLVSSDADISSAFSQLGNALMSGDSMLEEIGEFCVEVFGGTVGDTSIPVGGTATIAPPETTPLETAPAETTPPITTAPVETTAPIIHSDEEEVDKPDPSTVGLVYIAAPEGTRALPEGYSIDMLSLGNMSRTAPVLGKINSPFGYRIHPISGTESIHNGLDISGDIGDPIVSFGDGTVEYTGESDVYGLYFRIDHGNGVKSFYAHCSEILVHQGDKVSVGDHVANVGATGDVTGPHLHFELLCKGIYIDPALYIEHL